ncbi:MAG TPA: class I tRNA ligase family protein, partial [Mycobacteriales bacterium]|nr:class I tRNA ligase family protein [Mycobacteriales bacterium]
AEFNARCRESVQEHVGEFTRLTERMGYWVDFDGAYWTMNSSYVESVWWSLQQIFDKGLLVQDYRVTPYCPRCGTGLSDHEVAQGYYEVTDPSVYVRFPVLDGPLAELDASLLVWTTTPWTLISNTAVAVHPDVTYVAVRVDGEVLVVAEPLLTKVFADTPVQLLAELSGRELEHTRYSRPFDLVDIPEAHYVGLADYVTVDDGTGLVHQSPAFGAEDLAVARRYGDWLNNNIDWALSRNRYWGTPLPIWRCTGLTESGEHLTCVGSLSELSSYAGRDLTDLDPHRPFIDEITFPCKECGETATRVPEVIDCWYDAGSMPFAQWGAPHRNRDEFERSYPAQYICEAIDQTRGW